MIRVISLGWGVQSFTLAAMAALGEIEPVTAAVHADTTHERAATYAFAARWTPWLQAHGVRVIMVRNGGSEGTGVVAPRGAVQIPAYWVSADGRRGLIRRQCTRAWKVEPVRRVLQRLRRERPCRGLSQVALLLGITTDEWQRVRDSAVRYVTHTYPLLDLGLSRQDCVGWLEEHGLEVPGRSACVFCPLQTVAEWRALKAAAGEDWQHATATDAAIRERRSPSRLYVHRAAVRLEEAVQVDDEAAIVQAESCGGECWL